MSRRPEGRRGVVTRVLAIGGSAGAIAPLTRLVEALPAGEGIAGVVVVHRSASAPSVLHKIINRHCVLRAVVPQDGDPLHSEQIYVGPPDRHLVVGPDRIRLTRGPKVNGQRPAIDLLFESAAQAYGPAVVAVVLSGTLDDGSAGLAAVHRAGGQAIVLDPADAEFPDMPQAAIERVPSVSVAPGDLLPRTVADALLRPVENHDPPTSVTSTPEAGVEGPLGVTDEPGVAVGVTCPECGGSLWLSGAPDNPIVSCRVGHRMSPAALQDLHLERLERALWAALRALEEEVAVARFMEEMSRRRGDDETAERHRQRRDSAAAETEVLRNFLLRRSGD